MPRRQIRIGITTYLNPAWSGTVIRALELVSWSSTVTISWPMRQALDYGTRTVMLHEGRVILDVKGRERAGMDA